jgi:hypothetical protein
MDNIQNYDNYYIFMGLNGFKKCHDISKPIREANMQRNQTVFHDQYVRAFFRKKNTHLRIPNRICELYFRNVYVYECDLVMNNCTTVHNYYFKFLVATAGNICEQPIQILLTLNRR